MELNVVDRLILLSVLPKEGDLTTLKILRDLTDALGFTEEESTALEFQVADGQTRWKEDAAKTLEKVNVSIGPRAHALIAETFEALSKAKKLTLDHLKTFEKFVED